MVTANSLYRLSSQSAILLPVIGYYSPKYPSVTACDDEKCPDLSLKWLEVVTWNDFRIGEFDLNWQILCSGIFQYTEYRLRYLGMRAVLVSLQFLPIRSLVLCKDVKSIQYSQCRILAKLITCSDTIQEEYGHGVINFQADSSRLRKLPTALENRDGCAELNRPDPTRPERSSYLRSTSNDPHYQVYSPKGQSVPPKSRCSENHCNIIV